MKNIRLTEEEINYIKYLRKQKAQKEGSTNANNNDGANDQKVAEGKPTRKYTPQPMYVVLKKARNIYNMQVNKDASNKLMCMETALKDSLKLYPDQLRFKMDFRAERERLMDSTRFCNACRALGKNPATVADNVVFEGKATVNKVLKDGLQVIGETVHMFNYPLWLDDEKLYSSDEQLGNETANKEGGDE